MNSWASRILFVFVCAGLGATRAAPLFLQSDWQDYKRYFISAEGRVIDLANGQVSHSEGQGYAMLLAIAAEDRATFETIWLWTQKSLQRDDKLFAWRWYPNQSPPVQDWNNATDGDLLIAWALAIAGKRWGQDEWRRQAALIAARIRATLIVQTPFGPALLPGQAGFQQEGQIFLNPSYWIFPALRALSQIDQDPIWLQLEESGRKLLALTRFGAHLLPPDWVVLYPDARLGLLSDPARRRFSYDAIRIPIYLCWAGLSDPILMENLLKVWSSESSPAWIDLATDERAAYSLTLAQRASRYLVSACQKKKTNLQAPAQHPNDYYGSTLVLLSKVALHPKSARIYNIGEADNP